MRVKTKKGEPQLSLFLLFAGWFYLMTIILLVALNVPASIW
jgi:hypothetical protein